MSVVGISIGSANVAFIAFSICAVIATSILGIWFSVKLGKQYHKLERNYYDTIIHQADITEENFNVSMQSSLLGKKFQPSILRGVGTVILGCTILGSAQLLASVIGIAGVASQAEDQEVESEAASGETEYVAPDVSEEEEIEEPEEETLDSENTQLSDVLAQEKASRFEIVFNDVAREDQSFPSVVFDDIYNNSQWFSNGSYSDIDTSDAYSYADDSFTSDDLLYDITPYVGRYYVTSGNVYAKYDDYVNDEMMTLLLVELDEGGYAYLIYNGETNAVEGDSVDVLGVVAGIGEYNGEGYTETIILATIQMDVFTY
ncbi:MAG: hypothetical protein ACRCWQ_08660 [Bacilli bacterium]